MPSSTLMAAISVSIWARNISASSGPASPVDTRRNRASAAACERSAVLRRRVAVIGGGRAIIPEEGAPLAMRVEIAAPGRGVAARDLAEAHEVVPKTFEFRIDDRIGTIGRDHAAVPARLSNGFVVLQRIERALRRGDGLDAEALEQRARAEFRRAQGGIDLVVILVGIGRREPLGEAEQGREGVVEPHPRRRAAKEMVMRRETAPDRARVALDDAALLRGDAEILEPHALAVEHAENIVVGNDEQRRRIRRTARCRRTSADPYGHAARRSADRGRPHRACAPPRGQRALQETAGPDGSAWRTPSALRRTPFRVRYRARDEANLKPIHAPLQWSTSMVVCHL